MKKISTINGTNYDANKLQSPRKFEELLYSIFNARIKDDLKNYDEAQLMPGVAEMGRDVILVLNGLNKGVIQCKLNSSGNLSKPAVAKEIIKFCINYYQNNDLINDLNDFTYYLVCSKQFTSTSIKLLNSYRTEFVKEKDYIKWVNSVIADNKAFKNLKYDDVKDHLENTISRIKIKSKSEIHIHEWLTKYPTIAKNYFEVKSVTDNSLAEKIIDIIDPKLDKKSNTFITTYYQSAKKQLDTVKYIGHDISFHRPRNITVTKLYVEPSFTIKKESKKIWQGLNPSKNRDKDLKIKNIFSRSKNIIILGDPGAGKSLMVKSIMLEFIKNKKLTGGFKKYQDYIPFRIELRKYSEKKVKEDINIIDYILSILKSEYQINSIDESIINNIFATRKIFIFFDGLDEIFDINQKNVVRDDIESLLAIHKNIKCLITSRFIGYHDISFPEDSFEEYSIQCFNEKQISKFVEKFYSTQLKDKTERDIEIESFKTQLKEVDDSLKSNPLVLSLMSLLAINKIVIPDSKLEVYRACTNTLVETRDSEEKKLQFNLKVKSKRGTFGQLSYWQYEQMTNKKRVDRALAKKTIAIYLNKKKEYDDYVEAEDVAEEFLKYAERRSIYFDNNFTHKTFLEYYAADFLYTQYHNQHKIKERDCILSKYIHNSAWHIIFELLIAMIDEHIVDSEILDNLIMNQLDNANSIEQSFFFLSILEKTLNISNDIRSRILSDVINIVLGITNQNDIKIKKRNELFTLLNKIVIRGNFNELIQNILFRIENDNDTDDDDFFIKFYNFYKELLKDLSNNTEVKMNIINDSNYYKLKDTDINLFYSHHLNLLVDPDAKDSYIDIIELQIEKFGIESIFAHYELQYHNNRTWIPIFNLYLLNCKYDDYLQIIDDINRLDNMGVNLNVIKENYSEQWRIHLELSDDKVTQIFALIEKNENERLSNYLVFILSKISKRKLNVYNDKIYSNDIFQELRYEYNK